MIKIISQPVIPIALALNHCNKKLSTLISLSTLRQVLRNESKQMRIRIQMRQKAENLHFVIF